MYITCKKKRVGRNVCRNVLFTLCKGSRSRKVASKGNSSVYTHQHPTHSTSFPPFRQPQSEPHLANSDKMYQRHNFVNPRSGIYAQVPGESPCAMWSESVTILVRLPVPSAVLVVPFYILGYSSLDFERFAVASSSGVELVSRV
jgi:hypothetical protein